MARTGRPRVERVNVECASCGAMLERRKSEVDKTKSGRVFCNAECRNRLGPKPRRGVEKACEQCGDLLYVRPGGETRFCSKPCFDRWQSRNTIIRDCEQCGRQFTRPPGWETRQVARFCSTRCAGLASIKRPLDRMHNDKPAMIDDHGYVYVWEPDHPRSVRKGWIAEHRLVAEQMIGRPLTSDDEVHHINRIRHDNRPENLDVLDGVTHARITAEGRQSDTNLLAEYIRRFGPIN